jgi:hypothetical protein
VDLDGAAGLGNRERLIVEHGAVPQTAVALTPYGRHVWFRLPSGVIVPRRIGSVAAHVDILGEGGFAIASPSQLGQEHPGRHEGQCTGRYEWSTRRPQIALLPAWVARLANQREHTREGAPGETPEHVRTAMRQARGREYGLVALGGEAARVAAAARGTRNNVLNAAAFRLGRLIAGGELDRDDAERALLFAAEECGHARDDGERQAWRTIQSGIVAGMRRPRMRESRKRERGGRLM